MGQLDQPIPHRFADDLITTIGELHDNVWSHGQGIGVSQAQIYSIKGKTHIELAVADCGIGFFRELRSKGIRIDTCREAIEWCLEEGNTSKGPKEEDDGWSQRLPEDAMGSPMNTATTQQDQGNHHQGLGLYLLECLVNNAKGQLQIASGNALITLQNGHKICSEIPDY